MAISTYSELKSSIADWLNRADLTATIPNFIALAEAELNRRIRSPKMVVRSDATFDTQYTALPSDYLQMKSLYLKTSPLTKLQFVSNEEMTLKKSRGYLVAGRPKYFTIVDSTIECLPSPASSMTGEMIYYGKISGLSDSITSNWLLSSHPDIYLYGSLLQAAPYLRDDERVATWSSLFEKGLEQLRVSDEQGEFTGGVLKTRTRSY